MNKLLKCIIVFSYGIQYEPMAKTQFEGKYKVKVLPAGLFFDEEFNFLASSPDGLVGDNDIVEIKWLYSIKNMTLKEGVIAKKIKFQSISDQEGNITLKKMITTTTKFKVNLG